VTCAGAGFLFTGPSSGRAENVPHEPVPEGIAHHWHHGWRSENTCFGKEGKDFKEKGQGQVAS